jgi:hypothetical protein
MRVIPVIASILGDILRAINPPNIWNGINPIKKAEAISPRSNGATFICSCMKISAGAMVNQLIA